MFAEILPERHAARSSSRPRSASATRSSRSPALTFLGFGVQPPSPDWGCRSPSNYTLIIGTYWWTVLFPALAIATLVVGVNLIADGLQQVLRAMSDRRRRRRARRARARDLDVVYRVRGHRPPGRCAA